MVGFSNPFYKMYPQQAQYDMGFLQFPMGLSRGPDIQGHRTVLMSYGGEDCKSLVTTISEQQFQDAAIIYNNNTALENINFRMGWP